PTPRHDAGAEAHHAYLDSADARGLPARGERLERVAGVELGDAAGEEATHLRPLLRDRASEQRQPDSRVGAPQRMPWLARRLAELERCDPPTRRDDARELAQRGRWIVDVAQQVGEGQMVELAVGERQLLG